MSDSAIAPTVVDTGSISGPLFRPRFVRLRGWVSLGTRFLVGQTTTQVLNLLAGFVLLRWLSKEDYAQFSFAFGFQSMLGLLLDLGATGAITALVGTRTTDATVVGSYVAAAKGLRRRLAVLVLPLGIGSFILAGAKHDWPWNTQLLLASAVIAAVFAQGSVSIYSAPLLMHRRLSVWYRIGATAATGRLALFAALHAAAVLSGWLTAWVNTFAAGVTALVYRRAGVEICAEPGSASIEQRRELVRYLSPLIPGVVFTAFQSQITVFLITLFGRTENIAEVAALGRLGQIFALLAAFNGVVLQPHMAALPRERFFTRYVLVLLSAVVIAGTITLVGWTWPEPLLWLLGRNYSHLESELRLLLVASSLQYLGGVMWAMHAARKWIFWWGSAAYIGGTMVLQALVMATHDLSTTQAAMEFAVWSSLVPLAVHVLTAAYGFVREM